MLKINDCLVCGKALCNETKAEPWQYLVGLCRGCALEICLALARQRETQIGKCCLCDADLSKPQDHKWCGDVIICLDCLADTPSYYLHARDLGLLVQSATARLDQQIKTLDNLTDEMLRNCKIE